MLRVIQCASQSDWDREVLRGDGHPLQLWGWGQVKAAHSWRVDRVFVEQGEKRIGAAQLLIRRLPPPFTALVYAPRGPVCTPQDRQAVLSELATYAKQTYGAVALTIEPDWAAMPRIGGWKKSTNTILMPRTLILDLAHSDDQLLSAMTKKTRQYIHKSDKEAITIRQVKGREELDACLDIYKQTAKRVGFAVYSDTYYYDIFDELGDHSPLFAAFYKGEPIAFVWPAISSEVAFELFAGRNETGQRLRADYALQWHVIATMKKWGIDRYDFNGLPDDETGAFKHGFADHENMLAGTWDKPLSPLYPVWSRGLPIVKQVAGTIKKR